MHLSFGRAILAYGSGCTILALLLLACGEKDTTSPAPPAPPESFTLPFVTSFDEPRESIWNVTWSWALRPASSLHWSLDTTAAYAGGQGIQTPPLPARSGLMCGGNANLGKQCFCGSLLRTQRPVDLSASPSAVLTFMNRRRAVPSISPPSCWSTARCGGPTTLGFNVVWLDESESPNLTVGHDWQVLATFTGTTAWKEETVDLASVLGKRVYLGFWQNDQCVPWDSTSTSWMIDEVVVQAR